MGSNTELNHVGMSATGRRSWHLNQEFLLVMGKVNVIGDRIKDEGVQSMKSEDDFSSQGNGALMRIIQANSEAPGTERRKTEESRIFAYSKENIGNSPTRSFYDEDKIESGKTPNAHGELVSDEGQFKP